MKNACLGINYQHTITTFPMVTLDSWKSSLPTCIVTCMSLNIRLMRWKENNRCQKTCQGSLTGTVQSRCPHGVYVLTSASVCQLWSISDWDLSYCSWVLGCSRACNQSALLYNFQYVCFLASNNSAPTQQHNNPFPNVHTHIQKQRNTYAKIVQFFPAEWFKPVPPSTSRQHVFLMLLWQSLFMRSLCFISE